MPSDASFELKSLSRKKWGACAIRRIKREAMILKEKPLFVIRKPRKEITEEDIWAAFQQLILNKKQRFLFLRDNISRGISHT
jgi:ATP-dependent 26S proteasome regulatory subunit